MPDPGLGAQADVLSIEESRVHLDRAIQLGLIDQQAVPAVAMLPPLVAPVHLLAGPGRPAAVSLAQWQTPFKNQQGRGTCYAFATAAAIEAFILRRDGVTVDLSEHYLFHAYKTSDPRGLNEDPPVTRETSSSLNDNEGCSNAVEAAYRIAIPDESAVPYLDRPPLEAIRASIPGATPAPNGDPTKWTGQAQIDAFEFDDRHIPYPARHAARFRVTKFRAIAASDDAAEAALAAGHEVVADVAGHTWLLVGYDSATRTWTIKNSWGENKFVTYAYDDAFGRFRGGYVVEDVAPLAAPAPRHGGWLGRWHVDADGVPADLVIRRFTDRRKGLGEHTLLDGQSTATKLGDWYQAGQRRDVHGWAEDDGRKLVIYVSDDGQRRPCGTLHGQRYEVYQFDADMATAAGIGISPAGEIGILLSRVSIEMPAPFHAIVADDWIGSWHLSVSGAQAALRIEAIDGNGQVSATLSDESGARPLAGQLSGGTSKRLIMDGGSPAEHFDLRLLDREAGRLTGTVARGGRTDGLVGFVDNPMDLEYAPVLAEPGPGTAGPEPGIASWQPGRLDIVLPTSTGVTHDWYAPDHPLEGWESLTGADLGAGMPRGAAACSWSAGRLDVFTVAANGRLHHAWFGATKWGHWDNLGGRLDPAHAPGVAAWGEGRIDVIGRGPEGVPAHAWHDPKGGWRGWEVLPGLLGPEPLVSGVGLAAPERGRLVVAGITAPGRLRVGGYDAGAGGWTAWQDVGLDPGVRLTGSTPAVVARPPTLLFLGKPAPDAIDLFVIADVPARRVVHLTSAGGTWSSSLLPLEGGNYLGVCAASWEPGRLDVFVTEEVASGDLYRIGRVQHLWRDDPANEFDLEEILI